MCGVCGVYGAYGEYGGECSLRSSGPRHVSHPAPTPSHPIPSHPTPHRPLTPPYPIPIPLHPVQSHPIHALWVASSPTDTDPTSCLPPDPTSCLPPDPTSCLPPDPTSCLPPDPTSCIRLEAYVQDAIAREQEEQVRIRQGPDGVERDGVRRKCSRAVGCSVVEGVVSPPPPVPPTPRVRRW